MKKIIYPFMLAFVCLLASLPVYPQAPDGAFCPGQVSGPLTSFEGGHTIFLSGHNETAFGARPSVVNVFGPGNDPFIFPASISFTHDVIVQLTDSKSRTFFGIATRYEGPVAVESSIFSSELYERDMILLKTSNVATEGTYSVQAMNGNYLYGLRSGGGKYGFGVYFRIKKDGTNYAELYHFKGAYEKPEKLLLQYLFKDDGTIDEKYPVEFWGISFAGGSHGKGAVIEIELDGSAVRPIVEFTGQGGPPNGSDATDGEGPIAIVRDTDTDVYVITQSGGLYNYGAIFMIGQDGVSRLRDFTVAMGRPYGTPVVDRNNNNLYGISGSSNASENGFIYSMNMGTPGFGLVDFSASSEVRSPISIVIGSDGLIYGNSRRGVGMNSDGVFFSVKQDGTDLKGIDTFYNCFISVSEPANNATNVSVTPMLNVSDGNNTAFFYQLSETPDFSSGVLNFEAPGYEPIIQASLLKYGTTYYARARSDMDFFGPVTQFTTITAPAGSYVSSPANGATDISLTPTIKVVPVPGATTYTIELSKLSDFSEGVISVNTTSTQVVPPRLAYSTTYYSRVKTNLSASYGQLRQFTTHPPEKFCYVTHPPNGASYQYNFVPDILVNVVYGATLYTVELNTKPDFTGTSIVQTSQHPNDREFEYDGFLPETTYYSRVKTNLPSDWGPVRSFTTLPYSGPTIVINPAGGATGVSPRPAIDVLKVSGASLYTLQIYENSNFTGPGVTYISDTHNFPVGSIELSYSKQYFARVRTNLFPYSFPISFTTRSVLDDSYVSSPADGAVRTSINNLVVSCNMVWGATTYTVELNTNQNFTGTSFVKSSTASSMREFTFNGLTTNTRYYTRVKTNLSPQWGRTTFFNTTLPFGATLQSPADGETGVAVNPSIQFRPLPGATRYEVEIFPNPNFTGGGHSVVQLTPDLQPTSLVLDYSTKFYTRSKTDLRPEWGPVTIFTTRDAIDDAYVKSPADEATGVPVNDVVVTANDVFGAPTYTIELNTRPDFLGTSFVQTSYADFRTALTFQGLAPGTTYYTRVRTSDTAPYQWGRITSFTTVVIPPIVTSPGNNKTEISIKTQIAVRPLPGTSEYTLDLSTTSDFSSGVATYTSATPTFDPATLSYSTTYFTRVKTDITSYGAVTKFTTHSPEKYSFVGSPADGAVNVAFNNLKVTANEVVGATLYTIELNTSSDFTGTSFVKTSAVPNQRTIIFNGLSPSTTYYNRTRTNLPSNWGPVRSFTTAGSPPPPEIESTEMVRVYPNPFERHFTAEVTAGQDEHISVVMFDLTGRELYRKETSADFKEELGEELPQGLYLLKVIKGNTLVVRRMIKK